MKLFFTFLIAATAFSLNAQNFNNGGRIRYRETIQMKVSFDSDDPRMANLQEMIPNKRETEKVLAFKGSQSLYKNLPKQDQEVRQIEAEEGMQFNIEFSTPENIIFYDFSGGKTIQQRSFMGRTFLVSGQPERRWKITAEQKEILGFNCRKAILDDSTEVVAWYTAEIPAFTGPETFNGLPGLILELEMKNRTVQAIEILEATETEIKAPEKGKKVSQKQYQKIMKEKMEELQKSYGNRNGDNVIIIRSDQ